MLNVDKYLNEIGTFGLWHLWVFSWIFSMVIFMAAINVAIVFMNEIPDFACKSDLLESTANQGNWTFDQIKRFSCPLNDQDQPDCCLTYKLNNTRVTENSFNFSSNQELTVEKCNGPWLWHFTGMHNTVVTQWSLVCENSVQIANMQLVFMVGFFISCCTFGFLADKFGRRLIAGVAVTITAFVGTANALVPNFYVFLAFRFFLGLFNSGAAQCLYVLAMELCNEKLRKVMGAIYFVFYSLGYVGLAGIAYVVRDWRLMHIIVSAPCFLGLFLFWTIPESPRWLASQKRYTEVKSVIKWAAKWNRKKTVCFKYLEIMEEREKQNVANGCPTAVKYAEKQLTFFVIFKHWTLTLRAMNIFFNWFVNAMVYYGISLLITSFSGNIFLNNAISGGLETPAYLLCYPLLWWARKKSLMITLILAGFCGLLYLAVPSHLVWAELVLAFVGKLCITASFNLVFVVTVELYPTPIRGTSLLFSSMAGRGGSIVAPYITLMAQTNKNLMPVPMVIFGVSALVAGVLTVFIPESQGQELPETLDDILHYPPKRK